MKKYSVQLDAEQRQMLESLLRGGKEAARSQMHARILLKTVKASPGTSLDRSADGSSTGHRNGDRRASAPPFCGKRAHRRSGAASAA